ncbi:MAG: serine/threonine protein kinase, partial [Akkermansiaceae bacterium]|nr:serine/threonine protein kinase [Akkermansiaceae bacterium]
NERKALYDLGQSEEVQTRLRNEAERRHAQAKALQILSETRAKITQAVVLLRGRDFPGADALVAGAPLIPPSPEAADVFRRLADWHALNGRWSETVERASYLYQIDQYDADNYPSLDGFRLGTALIEVGDMAGYDHFRRSIISRFSASTNVIYAERTVKMALLSPASEEQMQELDPLIGISAASLDGLTLSRETASYLRWRMISISLGEYRRGNYELAESWARKCLTESPPNARRDATARILLACALFKQGHPGEARPELAAASEVITVKLRDMTSFRPDEFWPDWIIARILLREAQGLVL